MKTFKKSFCYSLMLVCTLIFSSSIVSCGSDNDDTPDDPNSIAGNWTFAGELPDEGYVTVKMSFKSTGECSMSFKWKEYSDENFTATGSYTVEGDLSTAATLTIDATDNDDYSFRSKYKAILANKKLTLKAINGQAPIMYNEFTLTR